MGNASDLAEKEAHRSSPASSRKASTPYHLRFVDPDKAEPALNHYSEPTFDHDHEADIAQDRPPLSGNQKVAVDDLLSTPRYVDAKALKRSTQAEIERIERERHSDHFANYAHSNSPGPAARKGLVWTFITAASVSAIAVIAVSVYFSDQLGPTLTLVKSALFGSIGSALMTPDTVAANNKLAEQKPVAQTLAAPAPVAQSQSQAAPQSVQAQPATQQQAGAQSPMNETSPLAKSLFELGALSCIARANQISKFLSNGNEAIVLQKPVGNPDKSLLMATMLPTSATRKQDFSIVTLSPNQASGCDGNYQSIRVVEKPCPNAITEIYGANRAKQIGNVGIAMIAINQFTRIFAIPAANMCVMVKQELVQ